MAWRAIAAEARRTGTTRQQILQKALDAVNWGATQAGGFAGQAISSLAVKRLLKASGRHSEARKMPYRKPMYKSRARTSYKRKSYGTKKRTAPAKKRKIMKKRSVTKGALKSKPPKTLMHTARYRLEQFKEISQAPMVYTGMSSTGREVAMMSAVADTVLKHYLAQMGDYQFDNNDVPANLRMWDGITFRFQSLLSSTPQPGDAYYNLAARNSSQQLKTYHQLVEDLRAAFVTYICERGLYLASVKAYNDSSDVVFHDPHAGKMKIDFAITALCKIQNTTPATCAGNVEMINNINNSPLDGYIYTFKNRVPQFAPGYLLDHDDSNDLNDMCDLTSNAGGGLGVATSIVNNDEFKMPPANPRAIFSNFAKKEYIRINPGQVKITKMAEKYFGTLTSFLKKYCVRGTYTESRDFIIPYGGSSVLIGLKPYHRSTAAEAAEINVQWTHTYQGTGYKPRHVAAPMRTELIAA